MSEQPKIEQPKEFTEEELEKIYDKVHKKIKQHKFDLNELASIPPELHQNIALTLISYGDYLTVLKNPEKFHGQILNSEEVLDEIDYRIYQKIEESNNFDLNELEFCPPQLCRRIALNIIEVGVTEEVFDNLEKFKGLVLDDEVAEKMLNTDHNEIREEGWLIMENIEKFKGIDKNKILSDLIQNEIGKTEGENQYPYLPLLDAFDWLDVRVAESLIEANHINYVLANRQKFKDLDQTDIVLKVLECYATEDVPQILDLLGNFDKETAVELIDSEQIDYVINNLEKFSGLDDEVALEFIKQNYEDVVLNNLDKFSGMNTKKFVLLAVEYLKEANLDKLLKQAETLDKEMALALIRGNKHNYVIEHLNIFSNLDQEVALALIKAGQGLDVLNNLNKFEGLDNEIISLELIKAGQGLEVMNNLDYFDGLDHNVVAQAMIEAGQGKFVKLNPDIFNDLSPEMQEKVNNL